MLIFFLLYPLIFFSIYIGCYLLVKPTIGKNESKYKYVDNPKKIGIYCDSNLYLCNDFSGPINGFSFTSFDPIVAQSLPEDTPLGMPNLFYKKNM